MLTEFIQIKNIVISMIFFRWMVDGLFIFRGPGFSSISPDKRRISLLTCPDVLSDRSSSSPVLTSVPALGPDIQVDDV